MFFWQSKNWENLVNVSNQAEKTFRIGEILAEKRQISMGKFGMFVIGVSKENLNEKTLEELKELTKKENCVFLQIIEVSYDGNYYDSSKYFSSGFEETFYKSFVTPFTNILDLNFSEDELLANLKKKGRYNVKFAEKSGVTAEIAEKSEENIKIFFELLQATMERDEFSGNNFSYYKNFLESLENSYLMFSKLEEKVLAAGIFVKHEDYFYYYYGASSHENKAVMAPYKLLWEAILLGKKVGAKIMDFMGVQEPGTEGSLSGVTTFKLRFSEEIINVSKGYLWIDKKFTYKLIGLVKKLKGFLKK